MAVCVSNMCAYKVMKDVHTHACTGDVSTMLSPESTMLRSNRAWDERRV